MAGRTIPGCKGLRWDQLTPAPTPPPTPTELINTRLESLFIEAGRIEFLAAREINGNHTKSLVLKIRNTARAILALKEI